MRCEYVRGDLNLFCSLFFLPRSLFAAIKWRLDDECYVTEYERADFFPVLSFL